MSKGYKEELALDTITVPIIRSEADFAQVCDRIEGLMGSTPGTRAGDELDALIALAEAFERAHYTPLTAPSPVEAVRFVMDDRGLSQRDLVPIFGSAARVSEFLAGKRPLSKGQILGLHRVYRIPIDVLFGA